VAKRIRAHVRWLEKEVSRTDRELDEADRHGGLGPQRRPTQGLAGGDNVRTDAGALSLYLAFILDTHSRRIVEWSMNFHMRTEFVVEPLEIAVWRCNVSAESVHHCDRGVQYTAISFSKRLAEVGITPPMRRTGIAPENAMAESFIATLGPNSCIDAAFQNLKWQAASASSLWKGSTTDAGYAAYIKGSRRQRGGYNGRSRRGVDITRPRDRDKPSFAFEYTSIILA
jgi:transposase InsO family protein